MRAGPTVTDLGVSGNLFNFKNADNATPGDYTTYPITAGNNSYSVWLRAKFTGTFNNIQNIQFWKSAGNLGTGETIVWNAATPSGHTTPATTSIGATAVPTSDPGAANVSIAGATGGALTASGYSDNIVLQLQTTTGAEAGDTETFTFTLQYDEN
jgi:hypothetical protein